MWTPKRILLLAAGFVLFFTAYLIYAHFLGGIDGLPSLPEAFLPDESGDSPPLPPIQENEAERKLRIAFGEECEEVRRKIMLDLQAKGMVLAAHDAIFLEDGRVQLTPFSVAIFGKERPDTKYPEINTLQCRLALLTFDKPLRNITEMNGRKLVVAELQGDIKIFNNRGTPMRDDDISLFTQGPLKYEEAMRRIQTDAVVMVTDPKSKPRPMTIAGTGMDLYLSTEPKPGAAAATPQPKSKSDSITGVDRISLRADVDMNLTVDPNSGFLGARNPDKSGEGQAKKPAGPTPPAPGSAESLKAENDRVVITTQGPFSYDLRTDRATFEIAQKEGSRPNVITVDRFNDLEGKLDHLECDHLELQFQRGSSSAPQERREERPERLEIETVRALGKEVILTSDAEVLEAHGIDFFYDKRTHLSTLKGNPKMWALKEGNMIEAPELQLLDVKGAQQATALGEGHISLLDKKTGKRPLEARWKEKLVYAKDGPHDLLTIKGEAAFMDHENGQELRAQLMKVWLLPAEKSSAGISDSQQRKPHRVDAIGRVTATGTDMRIHDTERLVIWFRDAPQGQRQLPVAVDSSAAPPATPSGADSERGPGGSRAVKNEAVRPAPTSGPPTPPTPTKTQTPKKPMDLSARLVEAHVLRIENKNELEEVWCEGVVRVTQEPATPEDKGTDIRGETLRLKHHVDGNELAVTGDQAQVQHDKLFILGSEINIDQTTNETWVNGAGVMRMPSNANFDGTKLAKPAELTVHWNEQMLFTGKDAEFRGNIQAEQDTGRLTCQQMNVEFDRVISLREGSKSGPPAKVQKVVCHRDVWVQDAVREGSRLVSLKVLRCHDMNMDSDTVTDESMVHASGPGEVRIFQPGTKGDVLPAQRAKPAQRPSSPTAQSKTATPPPKEKEEEFKLTCIRFYGQMFANNKTHLVKFFQDVKVIHVPTENPQLPINEHRPPPGSMSITCERLDVLSHKLPDGKTSQEMQAFNRVRIESQEFLGEADEASYDENKELVILVGKRGNLARLDRELVPGARRDTFSAEKITYNRLTGEYVLDGVRSGNFLERPGGSRK